MLIMGINVFFFLSNYQFLISFFPFSTLRILLHSRLISSTLLIFHTLHFSTLFIFHALHSTLHNPHIPPNQEIREDSSILLRKVLLSKMEKLTVLVWDLHWITRTRNDNYLLTNRDREVFQCKSFDIRYIFVIEIPRILGGHTACHTFRDWSILTVW